MHLKYVPFLVLIFSLSTPLPDARSEILLREENLVVELQEAQAAGRKAIHATLFGQNQQVDMTLSCIDETDLIAGFWFQSRLTTTGRQPFRYEADDGKQHRKRGYVSHVNDQESQLIVEIDHSRRGGIAPMVFLRHLWGSDGLGFDYADGENRIAEQFDLTRFNQFWFGRILEECGRRQEVGDR